MRPITVIGNWKMNGSFASNADWIKTVCRGMEQGMPAGRKYVVCAPAPYLSQCGDLIRDCSLAFLSLGAQDASAYSAGAYTGDVAAAMLKELNCAYVIVGHSERRTDCGETDAVVRAKAEAAWRAGLMPVVCIGETLTEREAGRTLTVLETQLKGSVPAGATAARLVVAYEPVWAIGTGKTPTTAEVAAAHAHIRRVLSGLVPDANAVRLLYGGSVKGSNAGELLAVGDVDGALVGGASLKADEFLAIAKAA